MSKVHRPIVWSVLLGLVSGWANAQEQRFAVEAGYGQTDNLNRTASNEQRSSLHILGLDIGLAADRPRLSGSVLGDLQLRRYAEDIVLEDDDEIVGSLDGYLNIDVLPDRFSWSFEQNYGQLRTDPLAAIGPSNRERVSVLSTTPQLTLPIASRTSIVITAGVSDQRFEDSDLLDSKNSALQVSLMRAVSPVTQVGLVVMHTETDFDGAAEDYEFDNVLLRYQKRLASGRVEASIGSGEVTSGATSTSSGVMTFVWTRDVGTRSTLSIAAGRELTDAGRLFSSGGSVGAIGNMGGSGLGGQIGGIGNINDFRLGEIVLTPDPLERSSLHTSFNVRQDRTRWTASVEAYQDRFDADNSLDNDGLILGLGFARDFTPRWTGQVDLRETRQEFDEPGQEWDDFSARIFATRALGMRAELELAFERDKRTGASSDYADNIYIVTFRYELLR